MTSHEANGNKHKHQLPIGKPVPVFNCVIHVGPNPDGSGVQARCAVMEDLVIVGRDERDALSKIATEFKQRAGELHSAGKPVPIIDPPLPANEGEETRWLPVHL